MPTTALRQLLQLVLAFLDTLRPTLEPLTDSDAAERLQALDTIREQVFTAANDLANDPATDGTAAAAAAQPAVMAKLDEIVKRLEHAGLTLPVSPWPGGGVQDHGDL